MSERVEIRVTVNGVRHEREVEPRVHLADFLRHDLGLTGTHLGCEHGVCGACTVLIDGASARSCLTLAVQSDGKFIETVEGCAAADGALNRIQQALSRHHGLQCGFCTPGIVMTLTELDRERAGAYVDEATIRRAVSGNLCRCTGYQSIVAAALELFGAPAATHDAERE